MKPIIIIIAQELPIIKHFYFSVATKNNCVPMRFNYPEDFELWCNQDGKTMVNDIKLFVLGQYFPGDGSQQRESGPTRGVLFYQRLCLHPVLKNVRILIPGQIMDDEYSETLKKYNVSLREEDEVTDMLKFGEMYMKTVEELSK